MFKFSVIIPVYNVEEYLEETILSIVNQSIGFEENIQLIIINDGSSDNSSFICKKYLDKYPHNIIYYEQKNSGVSIARNKGISLASSLFTTMLDSDDKWSQDSFEEVYNEYLKHQDINLFSCKMVFFDARKGNHHLNYKYAENKIINILEDYNYPQLSSCSIFIKTDILKKYKYDKNIKYSEDNKLINEIILNEKRIMMLKKPIYYYRKRSKGNSTIQGQTKNIDWYLVTPKKVYKYLFDLSQKKYGKVIKYLQNLVAYDLNWRILEQNFQLSNKEQQEYVKLLTYLIGLIDDDIILYHKSINFYVKLYILQVKNSFNVLDLINYNEDYLMIKDFKINKNLLSHVNIDQIYIRNNKVEFYGKLDCKFIPKDMFYVLNNNKKIDLNYYELTNNSNQLTFNEGYLHDYIGINFNLDLNSDWDISFVYNDVLLIPKFKSGAIFSNRLPKSYHHQGNRTICLNKYHLINKKRNIFKSFKYEFLNLLYLLQKKKIKLFLIRLFVKIFRIFKRKDIFLISDRFDKADDNGEHFFRFMREKYPSKKVYFVLSKSSKDYQRICKIGKVLDPSSKLYKLLFQTSDYIISSQAGSYLFNTLGKNQVLIQDQHNYKYIFLQHGITYNNLSNWLNVNSLKVDIFVTACLREYQSLLDYKYYYGKDVIKLLGFPRYDSLLEKKETISLKKQILFSLTWRKYLTSKMNFETGQREYNEEFKNSDYFKFINKFLNDGRLLKVLKDTGYIIKFCPHPNVLPQLRDFSFDKDVILVEENVNYQKEFCENKLLITDYSSVFFDFAYLNKPIIYYQEDKEKFYEGQIYDEGYFDYLKDGFGPLYKDYEKFVLGVIKYIKNDCVLEEKYAKRILDFFAFHDKNNCQRVYDEIMRLSQKIDKI